MTLPSIVASYDKVNKVVIYTNGTICPPDANLIDKIFVFVTFKRSCAKNSSSSVSSTISLPLDGL